MKKILLTLGLATALAIPTGLAVAAADEVSDDVPVTIVDTDDVRDQVRLHDCDLVDGEPVFTQARDQFQDPNHECGLCDGDAVAIQERVREQLRLEYDAGTGLKAGPAEGAPGLGYGEGAFDGTGPLHQGAEVGMANQFGPAGR